MRSTEVVVKAASPERVERSESLDDGEAGARINDVIAADEPRSES